MYIRFQTKQHIFIMKKSILYLALALITFGASAQIQTPAPSPTQEFEQKVGLTDVKVEYSRPSMRGRTIFGDLVPFDKLWRTGANRNTMITFGDDVMIGDNEVKAGTYAIFTKPGALNWEVYFYTDINNNGTPQEWDEAKVVAKVTAKTSAIPMLIETFTITLDDIKMDEANLGMMWEKTHISLPIKVMTDKMVTASIDKVMNGPSARDYYSAAVYYLESGKDINKAKEWIDQAVAGSEDAYWYKRQQSLIYAKSGDTKGAIKAAKASMEQAEKAGNMDYVAMNKKSLKEWGVK